MLTSAITGYIRVKVICVFLNNRRILVGSFHDPTKKEDFHCPLGGRVEFGESSQIALAREIKEELDADISNPMLLGVLENHFTFDGRQGHEVVFVYNAVFTDTALYSHDQINAVESNGQTFIASWLSLDKIHLTSLPVYPEGLIDLVTQNT